MSQQVLSLNRSPFLSISNATIPSFQFRTHLLPLPNFSSNSSCLDSDDSAQTVFNTISNFNISDFETPDEVFDSEPRPTKFSQPPFQPITPLPLLSSLFLLLRALTLPLFFPLYPLINPIYPAHSQTINSSMF